MEPLPTWRPDHCRIVRRHRDCRFSCCSSRWQLEPEAGCSGNAALCGYGDGLSVIRPSAEGGWAANSGRRLHTVVLHRARAEARKATWRNSRFFHACGPWGAVAFSFIGRMAYWNYSCYEIVKLRTDLLMTHPYGILIGPRNPQLNSLYHNTLNVVLGRILCSFVMVNLSCEYFGLLIWKLNCRGKSSGVSK